MFLYSLVLSCVVMTTSQPCDRIPAPEPGMEVALELVRESSSRRDGALGSLVDGTIVELLVISPSQVLQWLARNGRVADHLLENWQHSVFTDYAGARAKKLTALRAQLVCTLESYSTGDPAVMKLRARLLASAKAIRVRSID